MSPLVFVSDKPNTFQSKIVTIYQGRFTKPVRMVKLFSLSTSILGVSIQPVLISKMLAATSVPIMVASASCVGFFTFVTPLLLHWLTKRYVVSMDYNEHTSQYIATTLSFFLTNKKTIFKADDVRVPEIDRMFTTFYVKRRPFLVDLKLFSKTHHYINIMGYDKPLDISFDESKKDPKKPSTE